MDATISHRTVLPQKKLQEESRNHKSAKAIVAAKKSRKMPGNQG